MKTRFTIGQKLSTGGGDALVRDADARRTVDGLKGKGLVDEVSLASQQQALGIGQVTQTHA